MGHMKNPATEIAGLLMIRIEASINRWTKP